MSARGAGGDLATIVLAAGEGRRFGSVKQLATIDGQPLLARVLAALDRVGGDRVVVLGSAAEQVGAAPIYAGWRTTVAADWAAGPGASLRAGLAAVPQAEQALIVLGDLPWLRPDAVERVLAAARSEPAAEAVRAFAGEVPAHPVLIRGRVLERARQCPDAGLRRLLAEEAVVAVPCAGLGVASDVDVPADLDAGHEAPPED